MKTNTKNRTEYSVLTVRVSYQLEGPWIYIYIPVTGPCERGEPAWLSGKALTLAQTLTSKASASRGT